MRTTSLLDKHSLMSVEFGHIYYIIWDRFREKGHYYVHVFALDSRQQIASRSMYGEAVVISLARIKRASSVFNCISVTLYFTIEKWCSMKCRKSEVDSFNHSKVIAIQT